CPTVTASLVHLMLDRVRRFESSYLQDEKMVSLGRLSAGLAHELGNPTAAAARSAKLLTDALARLEDASRALGAAQLNDAQLTIVDRSRRACQSALPAALSTIQRADREDAIIEWLESHGADSSSAAALVETAVTLEDLELLASSMDGNVLNTALTWLAADCST